MKERNSFLIPNYSDYVLMISGSGSAIKVNFIALTLHRNS